MILLLLNFLKNVYFNICVYCYLKINKETKIVKISVLISGIVNINKYNPHKSSLGFSKFFNNVKGS